MNLWLELEMRNRIGYNLVGIGGLGMLLEANLLQTLTATILGIICSLLYQYLLLLPLTKRLYDQKTRSIVFANVQKVSLAGIALAIYLMLKLKNAASLAEAENMTSIAIPLAIFSIAMLSAVLCCKHSLRRYHTP